MKVQESQKADDRRWEEERKCVKTKRQCKE